MENILPNHSSIFPSSDKNICFSNHFWLCNPTSQPCIILSSFSLSLSELVGWVHGSRVEGISLGCTRREGCFMGSLPDTVSQIFFPSTTGMFSFFSATVTKEWGHVSILFLFILLVCFLVRELLIYFLKMFCIFAFLFLVRIIFPQTCRSCGERYSCKRASRTATSFSTVVEWGDNPV